MTEDMARQAHYGGGDDPYEPIKVMEAWMTPQEYAGFLKGNAMKYLYRHQKKGRLQDLEKHRVYSDWYVDFVRRVGYDDVYPQQTTIP